MPDVRYALVDSKELDTVFSDIASAVREVTGGRSELTVDGIIKTLQDINTGSSDDTWIIPYECIAVDYTNGTWDALMYQRIDGKYQATSIIEEGLTYEYVIPEVGHVYTKELAVEFDVKKDTEQDEI